jgi:hypothetical protein
LSSTQASAFEAEYVRDGLSRLDERTQSLVGGNEVATALSHLETENRIADFEEAAMPTAPAAAGPPLRRQDQAIVEQAATTIRNAYGSSENSVDDFEITPASPSAMAASEISLSAQPDACEEFQRPSVPAKSSVKSPRVPR